MLELRNISKSFGGVKALQDVSVQFYEGEVHAILGENGAGKSTLMKIVCGIYHADKGDVLLDGKTLKLRDYDDAIHNGISIVNQEINLIPESSIAENIVLDKMDQFTRLGFVDWSKINKTARQYMDMVRLDFDPKTPVAKLSAAHKQLIQIAKALSANAKVLMLDEPTSSLTQYEAETLFDLVRELKKKGVIMIFVSHKLEEVMEICDKVTVFRDGRYIGEGNTADLTKQQIVKMMIGRESNIHYRGRLDAEDNPVVLEARGISSRLHGFKDLSFHVRKGEILGFYGLVGSGRSELARTVLGIDKMDGGEVLLNGQTIEISSFAQSLHKHGIGYITENRKEEGLFLDDTIKMNINLNTLRKFRLSRMVPLIQPRLEGENADRFVQKLEIKTPSSNLKASSLSGGNQQKVAISKWLSVGCDVLVIDEPTVGVDVGAKEYIHDLIWSLAKDEQKAVILISSDMNEIISLARRLLVFKEKRIVAELKGEELFARTGAEISAEIAGSFI
ncbi:MAG: sugar ABC transporter ATP-binding protein [Christensenellaceae bacterium]|nr:sugar ABC transporter ATP-binding protein [Christensenellaceae bacterium]MEA5065982.1 sugar ABC transporter ATP-binding protein [Eubacteriales bacterium]MEA5069555.1 sugar ABC transporter ATP-binding protein [Christensenellaceae bacterium]